MTKVLMVDSNMSPIFEASSMIMAFMAKPNMIPEMEDHSNTPALNQIPMMMVLMTDSYTTQAQEAHPKAPSLNPLTWQWLWQQTPIRHLLLRWIQFTWWWLVNHCNMTLEFEDCSKPLASNLILMMMAWWQTPIWQHFPIWYQNLRITP